MQRERRVVSGYSGVEMATKRGARATNGRHNTHSLRQRKRKRRRRPKLRVVAEEAQNQVAEDASRPRAWNASSGDHAHEAVALGRPQHRRSRSQAMPSMPHTPRQAHLSPRPPCPAATSSARGPSPGSRASAPISRTVLVGHASRTRSASSPASALSRG